MHTRRQVSAGRGISRDETPEHDGLHEPREKKEEPVLEDGTVKWGRSPALADQFLSRPETCRRGPPKHRVFSLDGAEAEKELNDFYKKTTPAQAPEVIVVEKEKQFHEGRWLILLGYVEIEYMQLIQKGRGGKK
jgi:hypothetical protein